MSWATAFRLEYRSERLGLEPRSLSSRMCEVRRLTEPRTRANDITENAMVPAARNTSSAIIRLALTLNTLLNAEENMFIGQILKLTRRYMMKLPRPIQQAASTSAILVKSSPQTLA